MKGPRTELWFHSIQDFLVHNQGRILAELPGDKFRVELYSFMTGAANGIFVVDKAYFKGALFYRTDKEMRKAYDENYGVAARKKEDREVP